MTRKHSVILLGCAVVFVLSSGVAEECSQDISNENCTLTTRSNEIESLSTSPQTHEVTTLTPELMTTLASLNVSVNSEENNLRPSVIPLSSSTTNFTENPTLTETATSAEAVTPNSSEILVSGSSETSVSNAIETATSNLSETTALHLSTSNNPENLSSSEIPSTNSSESSINTSTSKPLEVTTVNSMELSNRNLTETPSNVIEITTLTSESSTSNLIETTTSGDFVRLVESSTSNSSDDSTSNFIDNPTEFSLKTSTAHSDIAVSHSEASTDHMDSSTEHMDTSTEDTNTSTELLEVSTDNLEASTEHTERPTNHSDLKVGHLDISTDHLDLANAHSTERSMDPVTTENLTETSPENPTENAMNEETTMFTTSNALDEPKGRALNFSGEEENPSNVLTNLSNHHDEDSYARHAIIHDDDHYNDGVDSLDPKILAPKNQIHNFSLSVCEKGGLTYENGEKLELGCESVCTCRDGKMDCTDRCESPYFRRGKKIIDPLCSAKEVEDPCCSLLVCAGDTETEPLEMCSFENKTYNRGDTFDKGCTELCTCEVAGKIACKPRCPPVTKTSDRCVEVPDPNDFCCLKVFCDVTLDEHDTEKEEEKGKPKLLSAKYVNMSAILLTFDSNTKLEDSELPIVEVSNDKNSWDYYKLLPGDIVFVKNKVKYLKIENMNEIVEVENSELVSSIGNESSHVDSDLQFDKEHHHVDSHIPPSDDSVSCVHKGKTFKDGEEYNDNCSSLCVCQKGEMNCLKIQCPTYFGVDVLDPSCIEWETVPPNFVPSPPNCCPDKVHCKNNGSCEYEGKMYKNWDVIPSNITGCEKKCYCEMGNVECQNHCPPVTALPPPNLDCPPSHAVVGHMPDDDCCKFWICQTDTHSSEILHNETESDFKGQILLNSTDIYMGPFTSKVPSKVQGPLAVYVNEDQTVVNNSLGTPRKPAINPNENPFYHKKTSAQNNHKSSAPKPSFSKDKLNDYLDGPYLGPFNPSINGKTNAKPIKDTRNKVTTKDSSLFVTPPPHILAQDTFKKHEHFVPNYYNPPQQDLPLDHNPSHINIHSQSSPEEILQFIHQHPEISNYPSGSVLEIHNAVPNDNIKLPFAIHNPGVPSATTPKIHLVPYIVPQNAEGKPEYHNLPPGLSLEEILREFQKNSQTLQNNPLASLPHPQKPMNYGPVLNPPQNGLLIHNKHNITNADNDGQILPEPYPGLAVHPQDEIIIQSLQAIDAHKVRLAFTVPHIIVGLHGMVEVRYTHNKDESDLDSWMLTVFAPPNNLIATPSLEFDLTDLKADTEYSIKITVTLRDLHNTPTSKIYKIKTPKEADPPVIPIDPDLAIVDINATWVTVVWRAFTQYELQFIDGIQLRYKEIDGRIYTATPLIHRAVTRYTLEKLKPNTKYEIGIYFIPFPGQMTELRTENILHFTTANEIDTYGFNVTLEISQVKSQTVEISWNGVPYPEDKYVNIYRAIYQSDSGKEDQSTFKIAKRDSPTKTIIKDLKPGTRYRLWLEVYLTNGKIKTSNVEDFITKPRVAPALGSSTQQDKLSRAEILPTKGDYYGPLVIVAILAAIAILSTLILLLILVRRHNQNKASITPPSTRISQSAYDNPTYKVEIQQETMGL